MVSYEKALAKFDEAMMVCKSDSALGGKDFEEQIQGWLIRDIGNLARVLLRTNRTEEAASRLSAADADLEARNYPELTKVIKEHAGI